MKPAQQSRMNEWLLGSTVMCPTCGCMWLVPALQRGEHYQCRQCGCDVPNNRPASTKAERVKGGVTELQR